MVKPKPARRRGNARRYRLMPLALMATISLFLLMIPSVTSTATSAPSGARLYIRYGARYRK
jgi:hypothetical protein